MQIKTMAENLGLEEDEFLEMVELYLETSNADFSEMEAAINMNDAGRLADRAHSIKGASGNLGFTEAYESAKTIEEASRNGVLDGLGDPMATLKTNLSTIATQCQSLG